MISRGLLRWKVEMHTAFETRLYMIFERYQYFKVFSWRTEEVLKSHRINYADISITGCLYKFKTIICIKL